MQKWQPPMLAGVNQLAQHLRLKRPRGGSLTECLKAWEAIQDFALKGPPQDKLLWYKASQLWLHRTDLLTLQENVALNATVIKGYLILLQVRLPIKCYVAANVNLQPFAVWHDTTRNVHVSVCCPGSSVIAVTSVLSSAINGGFRLHTPFWV